VEDVALQLGEGGHHGEEELNFPSPVGEYVPDSFPRTAPFGSRLRRSQAITASASAENGTSS
jgi:hypothetical protein